MEIRCMIFYRAFLTDNPNYFKNIEECLKFHLINYIIKSYHTGLQLQYDVLMDEIKDIMMFRRINGDQG